MDLKLQQAICLSLAGGFAILAPRSFPRNHAPDTAQDLTADDPTPDSPADDGQPSNTRARSRSRRTS